MARSDMTTPTPAPSEGPIDAAIKAMERTHTYLKTYDSYYGHLPEHRAAIEGLKGLAAGHSSALASREEAVRLLSELLESLDDQRTTPAIRRAAAFLGNIKSTALGQFAGATS